MTFALDAARRLGLSVRPMTDEDLPFIAALYASTRTQELAATGWPEAMQQAFLTQQHLAQDRHYRAVWPDAERLIVELGGVPAGRLYVGRSSDRVRVVDISLLPQARGRGFGSALLRDLQRQAQAGGLAVALSVVPGNPARRLYERLGFVAVACLDPASQEMVWWP